VDWLAATDDLLTQRLTHCMDYGDRSPSTTWVGVWDLACGLAVPFMVCARCKRCEGGEVVLREKLEARYARMA